MPYPELDLEEEIKKKRIADSLTSDYPALKQDDSSKDDSQKDDSKDSSFEVPKYVAEKYGDWRKWDTVTDEQVKDYPATAQEPDVTYPTIAQDQGQPDKPLKVEEKAATPRVWDTTADEQVTAPPDYPADKEKPFVYPEIAQDQGQPDKKYDTATAEAVVPYGEAAPTPSSASDYPAANQRTPEQVLSDAEAPDKLTQVERGTFVAFPDKTPATMPWHPSNPAVANYQRNKEWTDPDPDNPNYKTSLTPEQEVAFQSWVKKNKVPFDDSATSDYDMRGFWKAAQEGDPDASTARSKFDGRIHFNDKFKTPFHKTFSDESQYATAGAPHWENDVLVDKNGHIVADETPPSKASKGLGDEELAQQIVDQAPAKVKPVPGFIEGSTNAIANPAAGVIPPTPPSKYPDKIVTPEEASGAKSVVNPVVPPPVAREKSQVIDKSEIEQPARSARRGVDQTLAPSEGGGPRYSGGNAGVLKGTDSRITEIVTAASSVLPPGYTIRPTSGFRAGVQGFHSKGMAQDWQIFDAKGNPIANRGSDSTGLYTALARAAYGYQEKVYPELTGQFNWGGAFGTAIGGNETPDLMHFDLGGDRGHITQYRRATIGAEYPSGAVADRGEAGDAASRGDVLSTLRSRGLNVTDFGQKDDPYGDSSSRRGEGAYVPQMVPGYDVALNHAAWVAVGKPAQGAEFQFGGRTWRYGDKVPELYKDARFDIFDPYKTAMLGLGGSREGDSGAQPKRPAWMDWPTLSTEQESKLVGANQAEDSAIVAKLSEKYKDAPNLGTAYSDIDNNTDVPEELRARVKTAIQDQMTQQMIEYDPDLTKLNKTDPEKAKALAWAKWHNSKGEIVATNAGSLNPNEGLNADSLKDLWSKVTGAHIAFTNILQNPILAEQQVMTRFFKYVGADSETKKQDILNKLHDPSLSKEDKYNYLNQLLPKDTGVMNVPYASEVQQALDHLGNPDWMQKMADRRGRDIHDAAVKMAGDPRMRATLGGSVGDTVAMLTQLGEANAILPGGVGTLAVVSDQEHTRIKQEHPDWTEEKINKEAVFGTLVNSLGMELGGKVFSTIFDPLLSRIGNSTFRRLTNAFASAVSTGGTAAGASAITGGTPGEILKQGATGFALGLGHGIMHLPPGREAPEARPATPVPPGRVPAERQLGHTPVIEPDFEVLPRETAQDRTQPLKEGRIIENVNDDQTLRDNYTGPKSSSYDDHDANIAEVNGRNQQIAERGPLALGDRRVAEPGDTEPRPPPLVREPEEAGVAQPSGGAGDRGTAPPQPDIFGPPRRAATTPDEALAQVKGYHDEHLKLIQAMGWEHDPTQQPMANIRDDGHTIFIGGAPEHYLEQAKAHGITKPADQVEFARKGIDEEITHGLDFHAMRDDYDARVAAGAKPWEKNFHVWASNESARAMREMFATHDQAVASGDHRLAKMIRDAFDYSNKAYHHGALNWGELKKFAGGKMDAATLRDHLFRARMELARQMDQASRRGEITEGSTLFQKVARGLSGWIQKIVGHFKRTHAAALQGKLGPRFQQHIQGIINKRRSLDAMAHGAKPPLDTKGAFSRPNEHTPPPAEIQKPAYTPKNWKERMAYELQMRAAKGLTRHSVLVKSGESFGLDHPTTEKLARAERYNPVYRQKITQVARVPELARALKDIGGGQEREATLKYFRDWADARDTGNPLPAAPSPRAKRLTDAAGATLDRLGQIATNMGIKAKDEYGNAHPFTMLKNYFPRMFSQKTRDIFEHRDGLHKAEFDAFYHDALKKGVVKSRAEFLEKFNRANEPDITTNAFFNNAEHSRTMHLPLDAHDRSPDALIRYVSRMTDRLSDIKSYGQKVTHDAKDLFDHTNEAIAADQTLTDSQKQMMQTRVNQERNATYNRHFVDNFSGPSGKGRSVVAATALGNWFSSANNLIGGMGSNVGYGGPGSAGKAYIKAIAKYFPMLKDTEDRGILTNNLRDMMGDFAKTGDVGWLTRGRQGYNRAMMNWGGQNETENINRTVATQQAKYLLQKFQQWGAPGADKGVMGARARDRIAFFKRRGFTDNELNALWHEGGDPNKHYGDLFIKNYVLDSHGSYSPGQSASHIFDSPAGKLLLQFQKFGANQWRMQSREFIVPFGRSLVEAAKNPKSPEHLSDAGYQFARNAINFLITVPATGMVANTLLGLIKDKKGEEASWAQLGHEIMSQQYGRALFHYFGKMLQAYTLAGVTGPVANYLGIGLASLGLNRGRVKDPREFPFLSVLVEPIWDYGVAVGQEAGGDPSKVPAAMADRHLLGRLITQISGVRAAYQGLGGVEHRFGLNDPVTNAGRDVGAANDMAFLRSRLRLYEDEHPELTKRAPQSTAPPRTAFSPFHEDIQNKLISGDGKGALQSIQDYLKTLPAAKQFEAMKSIQASVNSSTPLRPGGQSGPVAQIDFLKWVKETQSPEDARQIFNLAQTYAKAALSTHVLGDPTMVMIARLDYDKAFPELHKPQATPESGNKLMKNLRAKQLQMK